MLVHTTEKFKVLSPITAESIRSCLPPIHPSTGMMCTYRGQVNASNSMTVLFCGETEEKTSGFLKKKLAIFLRMTRICVVYNA